MGQFFVAGVVMHFLLWFVRADFVATVFLHLLQVCFSSRSFVRIPVTCIFRPVRLLHIRSHIEHVVDVFISAVWFLSVFSLSAFLFSHILILLTLSSMNFLYFFRFIAKISMVSGDWPAFLSSVLQYPIVVRLAFLCWSEISGAGQPNTNCLVNLLLSILISMCQILIKFCFSIFSSILSMVNCFLTPNIFILFSCISLIGVCLCWPIYIGIIYQFLFVIGLFLIYTMGVPRRQTVPLTQRMFVLRSPAGVLWVSSFLVFFFSR